MEKLLELLNEYEKEIKKSEFYEWEKWVWWDTNLFRRDTRDEEWSHIYSDTADTYVISKKYGFIKWLVENDKIGTDPIRTRVKRVYVELEPREFTPQDFTDRVIMLLSISSSPIEDLISYLK